MGVVEQADTNPFYQRLADYEDLETARLTIPKIFQEIEILFQDGLPNYLPNPHVKNDIIKVDIKKSTDSSFSIKFSHPALSTILISRDRAYFDLGTEPYQREGDEGWYTERRAKLQELSPNEIRGLAEIVHIL